MLTLPYEQIVEHLQAQGGLSKEEIDTKINEKLEQLSGLISKEGAAHIIANELGIKLVEAAPARLQIKNIVAGMRSLDVAGKVLAKYPVREFNTGNRAGKVGSCLVADETGQIRIVMWGEQADKLQKFNDHDIISVESGYVKDNQGRMEIHLNEKSSLLINPEGIEIKDVSMTMQSTPTSRKPISELTEQDSNVEILGTVVQAFEPRFFERKNTSSPQTSYVLNAVIDDGTETIRSAFFAEAAAALLGQTHEQMLALQEQPTQFEEMKQSLLGSLTKVQGRVKNNEMFNRQEFIAREVTLNPDPKAELAKHQ